MEFTDLFLVNTRATAPLDADAPSPGAGGPAEQHETSKVADFVTQQSFVSFTVSTTVAKGLWKGFQKFFAGWADSKWLPFVICVAFGLSQFLLRYPEQ